MHQTLIWGLSNAENGFTFAKVGLERVSRETGGLSFTNPGHRTSEVFSKIESDLRNMYVLGFTPPADARDGRFHRLDVTTTRPDLVVRSRAGYWAGGTQ